MELKTSCAFFFFFEVFAESIAHYGISDDHSIKCEQAKKKKKTTKMIKINMFRKFMIKTFSLQKSKKKNCLNKN